MTDYPTALAATIARMGGLSKGVGLNELLDDGG